jgi:hypothetical protein
MQATQKHNPTRQAPGTPTQVSQGDRPTGNLRPPELEPERQKEQKPRPRQAHSNKQNGAKVTCTHEWRDLSTVEGPSKGGHDTKECDREGRETRLTAWAPKGKEAEADTMTL